MSGSFEVRYSRSARDDLLRLFDLLLERATTAEDLDAAQAAIDAIRDAVERNLSRSPFVYRKAGDSPFLQELMISFGSTGYVVRYEIEDAAHVVILAVRDQLEDEYH